MKRGRTKVSALAVAALALALFAAPAAAETAKEAGLKGRDVAKELLCQCGCSMIASECNHTNCPSAPKLIGKAQDLIDQNYTKAEILEAFIAEYGENILTAPPPKGVNLIAYITPYALIGLATVFVGMALVAWTRRGRSKNILDEPEAAADSESDDPIKRQLDQELKEYDF